MGDHVDHGAGQRDLRTDKDTKDHEAEVRDRGVGHQTHDVVLSDGSQAAPQDRGHGEAADPPL